MCSLSGVHQAPRRRLRTVANDAKCRSLDNTVAQQGKAGQWHWHLELPSKKYSKKSKLRSGREGGKMVSWSWEQEVDPNAETGARFWARSKFLMNLTQGRILCFWVPGEVLDQVKIKVGWLAKVDMTRLQLHLRAGFPVFFGLVHRPHKVPGMRKD